jgi:hypothetical protein
LLGEWNIFRDFWTLPVKPTQTSYCKISFFMFVKIIEINHVQAEIECIVKLKTIQKLNSITEIEK